MHSSTDTVVHVMGHEGELQLMFREDASIPAGMRCDTVRVSFGRLEAELRTRIDLDVRRVRDELHAMLTSPTLSGEVRFGSIENELCIRVALDHGKGTVTARLESDFGDHDGSALFTLTTDQAALQPTLRQLGAVLQARTP